MITGMGLSLFLTTLPLVWLFWSRGGLPGPYLRFPRNPFPRTRPRFPNLTSLFFAIAMGCWVGALVLNVPPVSKPSTLFLIDNSASMADPTLDSQIKITTKLKLGTRTFAEMAHGQGEFLGIDPGRVGLVRFSTMPRVLQPLTDDREAVSQAITSLEPEKTPLDAETNLVDGLIEALVRVNVVASPRRTIVLWTDGEANVRDNSSGWSLSQVAMAIRALGVKLIIADAGPEELDPGNPVAPRREQARRLLARLAVDADGVLLNSLDPHGLLPLFAQDVPIQDWSICRLVLGISGLFCGLLGIVFFWKSGFPYWKREPDLALGRSIAWPNGMVGAFRRFGFLSFLSWVMALLGFIGFYINWSQKGESLHLIFDVRPSMLAGQPSRMEASRRALARVLDDPAFRAGLSKPVSTWVMGNQPVRIFAPTRDIDAVRDELERLETWAEDPGLFVPDNGDTEIKDATLFKGKALWISDGFGSTPEILKRARHVGVLNAMGTQTGKNSSERIERSDLIWDFPGNRDRLEHAVRWGNLFSVQDPAKGMVSWLVADRFFEPTLDKVFLGIALALMVLTMLPGVARRILEKGLRSDSMNQGKLAAATSGPTKVTLSSLLILVFLVNHLQGQDSLSPTASEALENARMSLLKLKEVAPTDRMELLNQASTELDLAARNGAQKEGQWSLMRFLVEAHKRELSQPVKPSGGEGPDQNTKANPSAKEEEKNPGQSEKKTPLQELPEGKGAELTKSNDPSSGGLIGPGAPLERDLGLFDQLRLAQKRVANESTARRLSRIIPREWTGQEFNPGTPKP